MSAAELARAAPLTGAEDAVEVREAVEAAGKADVRDAPGGIGEQAFGLVNPAGLNVGRECHADLPVKEVREVRGGES